MPRGRSAFRKDDIVRAVVAVRAAGVEVARVEIEPDGKISIVTGKPGEPNGDGVLETPEDLRKLI